MFSSVKFAGNLFLFVGMGLIPFMKQGKFLISWKVVKMGSNSMDLLMLLDKMSLIFFSTLCIMVSCVLKFSTVYMESELFPNRFHYLVYCFVFSMFCMIFLPNFFFLLMGWDGLGMTSFLLVVYYLSSSSWAAGLKTYLMNRMGDGLFLVALAFLLVQGHWDINGLYSKSVFWGFVLVLLLGCFTKSAQFPFSSWLPAAMAAPTPVSALVHSSTLVTAGIYLMIRLSYMMPEWMFLMMGVSGMWTLFSASLAACVEWDGKKMVAFSTLSQLGFMAVAISLKLSKFAFFHLMTHALFKAMMFICVGYLMINKGHFQDLRSLSGMGICSPVISLSLCVSSFSLMGLPFFSGFFSKELMMEKNLFMKKEVFHHLLLFSLPFTSFYICRLLFQAFSGNGYGSLSRKKDKKVIFFSVLPLYMGSMSAGTSLEKDFLSMNWLYPCSLMKVFVLSLIFLGMFLAWMKMKVKKSSFFWFFSEMSFMSPFKGSFWIDKFSDVGKSYFNLLDQGNLSNVILKADKNLLKSGSKMSNSFWFFFQPKMKFYLTSLVILMIGISFLV